MTNKRENTDIPKVGDIVKFYNGAIGEVTRVIGTGWRAKIEATVNGTRVYQQICDIEVLNVLDRIVNAVNAAEKAENG